MSGKPPTTEYESGRAAADNIDFAKRFGKLKIQVKGLKDENKALKQEVSSKNNVIEKLEKTVHKLQTDE